jgi:hypothetical protein
VILVKSGAKIEKRTSFWAVFEKGKQNLDSLRNWLKKKPRISFFKLLIINSLHVEI